MMRTARHRSASGGFTYDSNGELVIPPTLTAWQSLTGQKPAEFKEWLSRVLLPQLSVWLEHLRVTRVLGLQNQTPSARETIEAIGNNFALLLKGDEEFVGTGQSDTATIWARACHQVFVELGKLSIDTQRLPNKHSKQQAAFQLLKFIKKNTGGRTISGVSMERAEAAREALLESTGWDLEKAFRTDGADGSNPASTQAPTSSGLPPFSGTSAAPAPGRSTFPGSSAAPALVRSTLPGSSEAPALVRSTFPGSSEAPALVRSTFPGSSGVPAPVPRASSGLSSLHTPQATEFATHNPMVFTKDGLSVSADKLELRVEWHSSEPPDPLESQTHLGVCSFDDFKRWAVDAFQMVRKREILWASEGVVVLHHADIDNDTSAPKDEKSWISSIEKSIKGWEEHAYVKIAVFSEGMEDPSPPESTGPVGFGNVRYTVPSLRSLSTDRARGYRLSQIRTDEEISKLITRALVDTPKDMLTNETPAMTASAADLNFESTNPFGEEGVDEEFGAARSEEYDLVQKWLSTPKPEFNDVSVALASLRQALGESEIITNLPERRQEDPENEGKLLPGNKHQPHQVCGLYWSLYMEYVYGCGINGDGCGTGKTHAIIAHIEASTQMWERLGDPPNKPTLVVCPNSLIEKTYRDLHDQLGANWAVYKYRQHVGPRKDELLFDPRHYVYKGPQAGRTVIIVSFNQLQFCSEKDPKRDNLFLRIMVDEAQAIRRCDQTKQGEVLKSFNAAYRFLFTGSLVVDKLLDLDGYLAFLEDPAWCNDVDLNYRNGEEEERSRYAKFKKEQITGAASPKPKLQDWDSDCESVSGLNEDQIEEKKAEGWSCKHWPAGLKYNGDRPASLERRKKVKKGSRKDKKGYSVTIPPPFEENPYDLYHKQNHNKLKCCTTVAFRYYVAPHVQKKGDNRSEKIGSARVKVILDILVLARNLFSTVIDANGNLVKVGDKLPPANIYTQEMKYAPDELEAYQKREQSCSKNFAQSLSTDKMPDFEKDKDTRKGLGSKFSKVSVLCTHIGLSAFFHVPTHRFRTWRDESLLRLVERMKRANVLDPADKHRPLDNDAEVVRQFLWGSPKLRFMVMEIQRVLLSNVVRKSHRKMFVLFQWPRSAEIFLKLVEFLGIRATLLDSKMKERERFQAIRNFDSKDEPRILIASYPLNIAGHDAQHRCCRVYHVEPAFNWATEHQAYARVYRIGQKEQVEIIRLFVEKTYQELHEFYMLKKASTMFEAFAELHRDVAKDSGGEADMPQENLAIKAFGMFRGRVQHLANLESSKRLAKKGIFI
ncbi:hypothetical protein SLS60_010387 [Paraconiothyrium brasiliense]|uniref:Helicase ATP-binding domain-containing protein n=1 Tax=Paraconiothyrium brasiliense TaxID=300254 RepID=A0ABR3QR48_9PLEO